MKKLSSSYRVKQLIFKILRILILLFLAIIILGPVLWMAFSAFKEKADISSYPPTMIPPRWTMHNINEVFRLIPIALYVKNSAIYTIVVTFFSVLFNSAAGYAFARMTFKGQNVLFTILMASMMIPFQVIMIPLFMEIFYMGLYDTFAGLVIPKFAAVIGIFFFGSFYFSLPKQLEEAGRLDGLTEFGIWLRIIMPLCKPALVTQAVLSLNACWNDLLWPLLMTNSAEKRMLPNGVLYFIGQDINDYGPTFAAGVISVIPILIIFIFGQRYFVSSIVNSGMKE